MNKNDKAMTKLSWQIMNSINFYYREKESNIKYEEYAFNGINVNNIEINNITYNSLNISWNIDNYEIIKQNYNNNLEFIIEMKQENKNEKFRQIYKGKYLNYFVNELIPNTNYELRICLFYEGNKGLWSQTKKVKTKDFDSDILRNCELKNDYIKILTDWTKCKKMELIYRGTRDGSKSEKFHELCDNKGPTIVLYKNEKGNIFGGYASVSWKNKGDSLSALESFIFTLTNICGIPPTKFNSKVNSKNLFHRGDLGPTFKNDICIYDDYLNEKSDYSAYSSFPENYNDTTGKGKIIFTGNNKENNFKIKEIEVFKVSK